jgi:hypothetical protein
LHDEYSLVKEAAGTGFDFYGPQVWEGPEIRLFLISPNLAYLSSRDKTAAAIWLHA